MDCEVKFGTIPFWERFCSACIMLLGGSVTFPSVRLNVNGKQFQPTLKAESPATDAQQLQAKIASRLRDYDEYVSQGKTVLAKQSLDAIRQLSAMQ